MWALKRASKCLSSESVSDLVMSETRGWQVSLSLSIGRHKYFTDVDSNDAKSSGMLILVCASTAINSQSENMECSYEITG